MEFVAMVRGVEFINDSKATNVNSTWFALESMNKPTVWYWVVPIKGMTIR